MAGYGGRISYEGDLGEASALVNVAIKHANKLQAWKTTQGLSNAVKAFDLGNGHYAVVAELEHMRAIHIVSPKSDSISTYFPEWSRKDEDFAGVVDVISGYVKNATIADEEVPITKPDGSTENVSLPHLKSFVCTSKTSERFTDSFRRRRLAVEEDPMFAPLENPNMLIFSEHAHVKPTCYSGAMRKVVQLLLGVGKVLRPTYEERWMKEHKKGFLTREQEKEGGDIPKDVYSAFQLYDPAVKEPTEVKLKFDYRFPKTHGIAFNPKNEAWVIEIGQRGVHAMRLYLDPVSTTKAGRKRYLEVSPELEDFFDEFGGMPIGYAIPTGKEFDRLKRAGEIVQLISEGDMHEFYQNSMYSSQHGWCFNSKGTEAHNTCYGYNDQGIGVGYHYAIGIKLAEEEFGEVTEAKAALMGLFTEEWQIRKIKRMQPSDAVTILQVIEWYNDFDRAARMFDDMVITPFVGEANLKKMKEGPLWHPAKPKGQPQIKFPEPLIGGLISHDFGRLQGYPVPSGVRCNTPMFVSFCDDTLEVVFYFYDPKKAKNPESYNTREECQIAGSWTSGTYAGDSYVSGNFYSTRWDWRETITPEETKTKYTIEKVGSYNYASADYFFSTCITVTSHTVFHVTYESRSARGRYLGVAVAFPQNDRTAVYMVKMWGASGVSESEGGSNETYISPQVHRYGIYNFVFHWHGGCGGECIAKKIGEYETASCLSGPPPDVMYYAVCPRGGYAWQNQQITVVASWGNGIIGSAAWPDLKAPSSWSKTKRVEAPEVECELHMINDSGHGDVIVKKQKVVDGDGYDLNLSGWWWKFSPDPESGATPSLFSVNSCLGSNVMNYMDDLDGDLKHKGGPDDMFAGFNQCYTGVIE